MSAVTPAGWLPPDIDAIVALALIAVSFLTSALTAAFGIGGGVALLAVMSLLMPVAVLIPVHGAVQMGSNAGRAWHLRRHASPSVIVPLLAGAAIGAVAGGAIVIDLPETVLRVVLGLFVLAAVWLPMPRFNAAAPSLLAIGGFATTVATMFVGATGPLVNALLARAFDVRQQLVANAAIAMTAQHALKIAVFGLFGFAFGRWLPLIAAMIASGYLGTMTGARLLGAMPERTFRTVFRIVLTLLALDLIRRGLGLF